ncbi:MAG: class I SAM-dependent methyltransferase [Myxococcota bacterium]
MSMQAVRDFINRSYPQAMGVTALAAALDAQASNAPLDPAIAARIAELLAALGLDAATLAGVGAHDAAALAIELRHLIRFDATLLEPRTRATSWSYDDDRLLLDFGAFGRLHGTLLSQRLVPALEGMDARLASPGAAFLDIGVGAGGLAIAMAELHPSLHVTGIDVFAPSLRLAREAVARSSLGERVSLREQGAEDLEDRGAFDLAWMPTAFMAERAIPAAVVRTREALRPGGWLVLAHPNLAAPDAIALASWRLRTTMFGGPLWTPPQLEALLRDHGFGDVRAIAPPGAPVVFVVGRRALT